ncbi:MAG: collagen-like protein [Pseudomonadota bacterium]
MPNDHDTGLVTVQDDCAPCGLHEPRRVAYFDGKMLTARDLTAEQTYHIGMRQLSNMLLEGEGTVCGLAVEQHLEPGCQSTHMVLRKGMALDCCGQEVVVPKDTTIPFREMIEASPDLQEALAAPGQDLVIELCRLDAGVEESPVLIADCCSDGAGQLPGRIAEGYRVSLRAVPEGSLTEEREVIDPDLKWVHSINTLDRRPTVCAIDEDRNIVYVSTFQGGASEIRGYDMATHAHLLTLTDLGPVFDVAAPRSSPWLVVAAATEDGRAVIHLFERTPQHLAKPAKSLLIEPAEEVMMTQVAVSDVTGSLVALALRGDGTPVLASWSSAALDDATPAGAVHLADAPLNADLGAMLAGCRHIAISPNGRWLALLLPQFRNAAIFVSPLSQIIDGDDPFSSGALMSDIRTVKDEPRTDRYLTSSAIRFSYDSALLHVVGRHPSEDGFGIYNRVSIDEEHLTEIGTPARFAFEPDPAAFPAVYVAPDERWLYISAAAAPQFTQGFTGALAVYATAPVLASGDEDVTIEPIQQISLDAQLCAGALNARGVRMYVPGFMPTGGDADEDEEEIGPIRGRVMVIEITEADIAGMFETAIDGCRTCADDCACVRLAHVSGYVFDPGAARRIVDAEEDVGAQPVGRIDNLSHRPIVPSNVRLMEAILEIAARGVTAGPPGPRGEDGARGPQGQRGLRGLRGFKGDPGNPGADGDDGASIVEVTTRPGLQQPILEPVGDDWRLVLPQINTGGGGSDFEWPQREEYLFVEGTSFERGQIVGLNDTSNFSAVEIGLSESVQNRDALLLFSDADDGLVLSGALEIRVHTWGSNGADKLPEIDSPDLMRWLRYLDGFSDARTFQYTPVYSDPDELTTDGQVITLDLNRLWTRLAPDGVPQVNRARIEFVLHGSVLITGDKPKPFDGFMGPGTEHMKPSDTGGTWRSWIEVLKDGV